MTPKHEAEKQAMVNEPQRWHVLFSGQVQGVGFRFRTVRLASQHGVAGYVKNLPDGRVELVAEGPDEAVAELLRQLQSDMAGLIRETEVVQEPGTGEFAGFEIRH